MTIASGLAAASSSASIRKAAKAARFSAVEHVGVLRCLFCGCTEDELPAERGDPGGVDLVEGEA